MVECAVYELEAQVTQLLSPGQMPCLARLCRKPPAALAATVPGVRSGRGRGGTFGLYGGDQVADAAGRQPPPDRTPTL